MPKVADAIHIPPDQGENPFCDAARNSRDTVVVRGCPVEHYLRWTQKLHYAPHKVQPGPSNPEYGPGRFRPPDSAPAKNPPTYAMAPEPAHSCNPW
jgi:hypothetical protein